MVCFSNYAHRTRMESTSAEARGAILAAALQSFQNTNFCIKVVLSGQLFELTSPPEYQALFYGLHVLKCPRAAERCFLRDAQSMKTPFLVYLSRLDTHDGLFLWTWRPILMCCWYGHFQIQYINFGIPLPHKRKSQRLLWLSSSLLHLIH